MIFNPYLSIGKVKVNLLLFIPLIFLFAINSGKYFLILFMGVLIHESGHFVAAKLYRRRIETFEIGLLGAKIVLNSSLDNYSSDVIIFLSGSISNIFASAACVFFIRLHPAEELFFLFFVNIFYAFFNLLPIKGLDGGEALEGIVSSRCDPFTARAVIYKTSFLSLLALMALAVYLFLNNNFNFSLVLMVLYLFMNLYEYKK